MPADRDDGVPIRRYTRGGTNPHLVPISIGVIGVAVLLLAGGVVALLASGSKGRPDSPVALGGNPKADGEGQEWTAKRLAEHLKSRGAIDSWEEIPGGLSNPTVSPLAAEGKDRYPAALIRMSNNRTVKVICFPGVISCEEAATNMISIRDPLYVHFTWGKLLILPQNGAEMVGTDLTGHLPGMKLWTVGKRGVSAESELGSGR